MLAKRRIPQMSIEKVPTDFYILIRKYWWTYPKTGPVAMPIFTSQVPISISMLIFDDSLVIR